MFYSTYLHFILVSFNVLYTFNDIFNYYYYDNLYFIHKSPL